MKIQKKINIPLALILLFSAVVRVVYLFLPSRLIWDASVYIGMAKYIASGAQFGLWEFFRPPLWPIILSSFSYLGLDEIWSAKILVLLLSLVSIYLSYEIGESIKKNAGIIAATFLSFATPFAAFSVVPMTEVPTTTFLLFSTLLLIKKRYFLTGIFAALTFTLRFPLGLILPVFFTLILFENIRNKYDLSVLLRNVLNFAVGAMTVLAIYFFSNHYLYGSMFLPLLEGKKMIEGLLWFYSKGFLYYVMNLVLYNPIQFFTPFALFAIKKRDDGALGFWTIFASATTLLIYFSIEAHKELRYITPVIPLAMILAGVGVAYLLEKLPKFKFFIILVVIVCFSISLARITPFVVTGSDSVSYEEAYSSLAHDKGSVVLTSTPIIASYSPVLIIPAYDSWSNMERIYEEKRMEADYMFIDSCELWVCDPGEERVCEEDRRRFINKVSLKEELLLKKNIQSCDISIYSITK